MEQKGLIIGGAAFLLGLGAALWFWAKDEGGSEATSEPATAATAEEKSEKSLPRRKSGVQGLPKGAVLSEIAANEKKFRVQVRFADGRPVVGALILVLRGDEPFFRAATDTAGASFLPDRARGARAVVAAASAPVQTIIIDETAETPVLTLAGGVRIAGKVLANGIPPTEPLRVQFTDDAAAKFEIPAAALTALQGVGRGGRTLETWTTAAGLFEFSGLGDGVRGVLTLPDGGAVDTTTDQPLRREVRAPVEDVVLYVRRLPPVRGTVVDAMTSRPVEATVDVELSSPAGVRSHQCRSGADGVFEFNAEPGAYSVKAFARAEDGRAGRIAKELLLKENADLGEIRVAPTAFSRLVVVDPAGNPIVDATVESTGDGESTRTDAAGTAGVSRGESLRRFRVAAAGFWAKVVDHDAGDVTTRVTLETATLLEVLCTGEALGRFASFTAILRSEAPLFTAGRLPEEFPDRGSSHLALTPDAAGRSAALVVRNGEPSRISGLAAGAKIEVSVLDDIGHGPAPQTIVLSEGERKRVSFRFDGLLRAFRASVKSREGVPLADAEVTLFSPKTPPERWKRARTGADGVAAFEVYGDSIAVAIEKKGFARFEKTGIAVPPRGGTASFLLDVERVVQVVVTTESGKPAPHSARVWARLDATARIAAEPAGEGRWTVRSLPPGKAAFVVEVGGLRFEELHDTSIAEAKIEIPDFGRAVLVFAIETTMTAPLRVRLDPQRPDGVAAHFEFELSEKSGEALYTIDGLMAGSYRAELEMKEASDGAWRTLGLRADLEITADAETRVKLER